jgi:hypothetical protein
MHRMFGQAHRTVKEVPAGRSRRLLDCTHLRDRSSGRHEGCFHSSNPSWVLGGRVCSESCPFARGETMLVRDSGPDRSHPSAMM